MAKEKIRTNLLNCDLYRFFHQCHVFYYFYPHYAVLAGLNRCSKRLSEFSLAQAFLSHPILCYKAVGDWVLPSVTLLKLLMWKNFPVGPSQVLSTVKLCDNRLLQLQRDGRDTAMILPSSPTVVNIPTTVANCLSHSAPSFVYGRDAARRACPSTELILCRKPHISRDKHKYWT